MTRISRFAAVLALLAAAALAAPSPGRAAPAYAPDHVLVRFRTAAPAAARAAALGAARAQPLREIALGRVALLRVADDPVAAAAALARDPAVEWAEPDWVLSIARAPDDTRYPDQWSLHNRGQDAGTPGADIRAEAAWELVTGDSNVVVGVIDTGLDYLHPDLPGNVWTNPGEIPGNGVDDEGDGFVDDVHGWDFANGDADPYDDNGHGTHVAGTIAATGNNALGIAGVAWRTRIMALKFLAANGTGLTSNALLALQYAVAHGVRITNNSWGGGPPSQALAAAFDAAGAAGMLIVVAAGNSGSNLDASPGYPASYPTPQIVTVAATDKNDQLAGYSNYGPLAVDMAAPGSEILSLWPQRRLAVLSGTSMAAPHVAGAAALMLARDPTLDPLVMKNRLMRGCDPLPALAGKVGSGGRLDLLRSVADPDTIAAGAIADLRVTGAGSNSLRLAWTAAGDDGDTGRATLVDLRVAAAPMDSAAFEAALRVHVGDPSVAGATDSARVLGLAPLTTYWFAARAEDEFGNRGPLTASVAGTTLEPPRLAVAAGALTAALQSGDSLERTLTITNASPGTLDWHVPPPDLGGVAPAARLAPVRPPAKGAAAAPGAPLAMDAGGPDAFGYRWLDSTAPGGPGYVWVDIERPEHQLDLSGDDALGEPVPLGFEFPFYGKRYTAVRVCTNGYLSFEEGEPAYANVPLPAGEAPGRLVAPFWDDLTFGFGVRRAWAAGDGARFVVTWRAVSRFADPLGTATFQAILEPSGEIRFQYGAVTTTAGDCTVGIQDGTRTVGLTVAANQPYVRDSLAVRIVPLPRWVAVVPDSGSLGPGASMDVRVRFDATRLGTGALATALHVLSNDPLTPDTALAATLDVTGVPIARLHAAALAFPPLHAGRRDTLRVRVENAGGAPLPLLAASAAAPFRALFAPHVLEAGASEALAVEYAPPAPGDHAGTLTLATGDPAHAQWTVALTGSAVPPPAAALVTASLRLAAANGAGELARVRRAPVVLRNDGGSPLHWSASVVQAVPPPPAPRARGGAKGAAEPFGARGSGAIDAAGYRWLDSDAPGGPEFAWNEIADAGARLFGGADDSTRTDVPLPFAFPFYGDTFTTVNVCTNGWLSFSNRSTAFLNGDLPDTAAATPRHLVAPFWDDLDLRPVGGHPAAFAWWDGEKFTVEWRGVAHFAVGGPYTFEVLLWPDGAIDFQYLSMAGGVDQATIGLQNGDGTVGQRVVWNAPYVHDGLRVRLARRDDWLRLDRRAGAVPAGGADTLWVTADAAGWEDGAFAGAVRVTTDDPLAPLVTVPVALHVGAVRATAALAPARLGAVSLAPQVTLAVDLAPALGAFVPGTVTLAGAPERAGEAGVRVFDAIELRARTAAGAAVALPFAGEVTAGTWVADTVWASIDRASFAAGPLAPFAALAPDTIVRAGTTLPFAWTDPPGAERVEVALSEDGGRSWRTLGSTHTGTWPYVAEAPSAASLVELRAVRADTVFASWLSAPFAVAGAPAPRLEPAAPPAGFALRVLDARAGRLPVRLEWALPVAGEARLDVLDVRGARVRVLARGPRAAGVHELAWDGRDGDGRRVPPGAYFVRAEAAGRTAARRLVVLR